MLKKVLLAIGLLVLLLFAYEAYRLVVAERKTAVLMQEYGEDRLAIRSASLPKARLDALLKIEDPSFYDHNGVDFSTPGQGLTTITQGLVKYMYFDRFTPGLAKIEQSLIARFVVNRHFGKQHQLDIMLNHAYLGSFDGKEVRGFGEAAQTYFSKSFEALNDREFIGLVGMMIAPNNLDPVRNRENHERRVARIESYLAGKCKPTGLRDVTYEACDQSE